MNTLMGLAIFFLVGFWLWALVDLSFSTFQKTSWKIAWILIIFAFPLLGAILYFLLKKDFVQKPPKRFRSRHIHRDF